MNKKNMSLFLGLAALCSMNQMQSMDQPNQPIIHRYADKMFLRNDTGYDIAFKFVKANHRSDDIRVLPAGKLLLLDFTPINFSIKRSGFADNLVSSYTDYNLLELVTNFINKTPTEAAHMKSSGCFPMVIFESGYTGWIPSVKWYTPSSFN